MGDGRIPTVRRHGSISGRVEWISARAHSKARKKCEGWLKQQDDFLWVSQDCPDNAPDQRKACAFMAYVATKWEKSDVGREDKAELGNEAAGATNLRRLRSCPYPSVESMVDAQPQYR